MVVGGSCIFCYKDPEGIKIDEASCPCGRGYVTKDGFFVNGRRVKEEKVPAKKDYEEHVRLCKKCRNGAHDCFWSDEPNDYNSFFIPGSGILLQVIRQYNEDHGGPHGEVRPAEFKTEVGFLVKSRVKYTERMREELRQQSAHAQRRGTAGEQRRESSTPLRQHVLQPRQESMVRPDGQQTRRTAETVNDPRPSLPEDFNSLHLQEIQGHTTTTRSNPIFPREEGGRVLSAGQSFTAQPGNVPTSTYSSSPPGYSQQGLQPAPSFGHTFQTSSYQPMSPSVTTSAQIQPQDPAYTSPQGPLSSSATTSYTLVNRGTARSERNTTTYRDQQSRRDGSSGRTGLETSRRTEQSPLSRTIPRRESLDGRKPEITTSTAQTSSHQPWLPSSSNGHEQGSLTVRRELQPRDTQGRSEARPEGEPTTITSAFHPLSSYQEAIPSADSETTRVNTTSYSRRQPSEVASSAPTTRTSRHRFDDAAEDDRVSPAPTSRRRQESIREERPSYEHRTSQPQSTRPSRMSHDDEDSDSRASPAPTAQRRRESVREDRPAPDRRRSSVEQQTPRTLPRTSRPSLEDGNDDPRDRQPAPRAVEGRPRREPSDRERVRRW